MIQPNEDAGGRPKGAGVLSLMRSLERQLAKKEGKPSNKAQELYYDALEADSLEEKFELLQQALKLDPGNVDALLAVLQHRPLPLEDEIEILWKILELAERRLGAKAFKEYEGHFWGFVETRPYMRARQQLAASLCLAGRIEEGVAEYEGMLELNPNDNQGVRFALLTHYLGSNEMEGAARLFERYDECEWNTVFAWGRVLERFLRGDAEGAKQALVVARKQNGYTEAFLKGHRRLPRHLPDSYSPGSREEAVCFAPQLQFAWNAHPRALEWLKEQLPGRGKKGG